MHITHTQYYLELVVTQQPFSRVKQSVQQTNPSKQYFENFKVKVGLSERFILTSTANLGLFW